MSKTMDSENEYEDWELDFIKEFTIYIKAKQSFTQFHEQSFIHRSFNQNLEDFEGEGTIS